MRGSTGVPPSSWWQTGSKGRAVTVSVLFCVFVLLLLFGLDVVTVHYRPLYIPMLIIDASVAFLCGGFMLTVIRNAQARHRAMLNRLEVIAEMNHHIRNALDEIALSAHTLQDSEMVQNIDEAVARIQWTLREILPQQEQQFGDRS